VAVCKHVTRRKAATRVPAKPALKRIIVSAGSTTISTPRDGAEALRPLAGDGAYWPLRRGLIRAGMLGVPVLAGSCVYAIAGAAGWIWLAEGSPPLAHGCDAVIALAMTLGPGLGGGVLPSCCLRLLLCSLQHR
jgi:hypothetical protein